VGKETSDTMLYLMISGEVEWWSLVFRQKFTSKWISLCRQGRIAAIWGMFRYPIKMPWTCPSEIPNMLVTLQTLILVFMRNGFIVQSIFSYLTFLCVLLFSGLTDFQLLSLENKSSATSFNILKVSIAFAPKFRAEFYADLLSLSVCHFLGFDKITNGSTHTCT